MIKFISSTHVLQLATFLKLMWIHSAYKHVCDNDDAMLYSTIMSAQSFHIYLQSLPEIHPKMALKNHSIHHTLHSYVQLINISMHMYSTFSASHWCKHGHSILLYTLCIHILEKIVYIFFVCVPSWNIFFSLFIMVHKC